MANSAWMRSPLAKMNWLNLLPYFNVWRLQTFRFLPAKFSSKCQDSDRKTESVGKFRPGPQIQALSPLAIGRQIGAPKLFPPS